MDIEIVQNFDDTCVQFKKMLWHDSEIHLAKCFGFLIDNESGTMLASLKLTSKQALYHFIALAFKNFSESPEEERRRNEFYTEIDQRYAEIDQYVDSIVKEKLPYYDKIYAHQKEGLTMSFFRRCVFFAFEMRLGKSITSASISSVHKLRRTVIICPAIAKWGWYRDLTNNWGYDELYFTMLDSSKSKSFKALQERFIIVNYDILSKFKQHLFTDEVHHFIIDECHKIKNHTSQRAKIIKEIVDHYPNARITLLSGTPIPNRFNDLYSYFNLTGHELGKSYKAFVDEYTTQKKSRGGTKINGARNIGDLRVKMANFMLRKRMDECFDMPEDVISSFVFQMDDYRDEYNKIIEELATKKEISSLTGNLHSLNILISKAKMPGIIQAIEDILEELTDSGSASKIVVFGSYREPLEMLEKHFDKRCVKVDGSVNAFDRDRLRNEFTNNPEVQVFLGNYIAAGEAMELSIASDWMCINFPFTPREINQAKFRIKHPEKRKSNRYHYTFCEESIDEYIYELVVDKERDINALIDGGKDVAERENIAEVLVSKLLEKKNKISQGGGIMAQIENSGEATQVPVTMERVKDVMEAASKTNSVYAPPDFL